MITNESDKLIRTRKYNDKCQMAINDFNLIHFIMIVKKKLQKMTVTTEVKKKMKPRFTTMHTLILRFSAESSNRHAGSNWCSGTQ